MSIVNTSNHFSPVGSMNSDFNIENIAIEKLTEEHDAYNFDCGDKDLNEFIQEDALTEKYEGWNQTYVAVQKGTKKILGFFAISNDSFAITLEVKKEKEKPYPQIPATKIGRLAVDKDYQNKGMGKFLVKYAIGFVTDQICKNTGCRYITVDSYPDKVEWYLKNFPFVENTIIKEDSRPCINLILDLKNMAEKLTK